MELTACEFPSVIVDYSVRYRVTTQPVAVEFLRYVLRGLGVALDDLELSKTGVVTGKWLDLLFCSFPCLFVHHSNRPSTYHVDVYIRPRVVSLSGDERKVSVVALDSDFIHLTIVFSNHLVCCYRPIRPIVVLADGVFGSRLTGVFERLVIPLY